MTAAARSVKIGREFFAKAANDYADADWALVREFYQNGADAPRCSRIEFTVASEGANTRLVVRNNGAPMTEEVLTEKLLTLGGSGKNFGTDEGETVGGFGKAKEILYFSHLSYEIWTGTYLVQGSGGDYTLETASSAYPGTRSEILIEGDRCEALRASVRKLAKYAQWKGELALDGETLETDLKKGARRREFAWGIVYSNNSFANVAVVRIGGVPMFTRYTRFKGCIVVELKGKSSDTLTSNRDDLKYPYVSEFNDLLVALAVDKRTALREQKAQYKRYLGEKLRAEKAKPKAAEQGLSDIVDVAAFVQLVGRATRSGGEAVPATVTAGGIRLVVEGKQDEVAVGLGHEFIIKNTTGLVTPAYYAPGPEFSKYSKQLVQVWAGILVKLHQICEHSDTFSVGFVLDEENEAEHEQGVYGRVYYLNPARVVCQRDKPQCRSFKARFTGAWTNRFELLAVAVHEFVHGLGYGEHDEDYAAKLTEVMGVAFAHIKEFNPIFKGTA